MADQTTFKRLRHLLGEQLGLTSAQEADIKESTSLNVDLGCDSLDDVELLMACEEEWGIEIDDEDAEKVSTVGEAVQLIHRLTN